jgi:pyridoxine 5-phosphate synthase
VISGFKRISSAVRKLKKAGILVSLFIDPDKKQIDASKKTGAGIIELHTGRYSEAKGDKQKEKFFNEIKQAVNYSGSIGLSVNAGHGLDYANVRRIAKIPGIAELNIGYSIICKAIYVGLFKAVEEMRELTR